MPEPNSPSHTTENAAAGVIEALSGFSIANASVVVIANANSTWNSAIVIGDRPRALRRA